MALSRNRNRVPGYNTIFFCKNCESPCVAFFSYSLPADSAVRPCPVREIGDGRFFLRAAISGTRLAYLGNLNQL